MSNGDDHTNLTTLISRAQRGDAAAAGQLFNSVYPELRRMAKSRLRKNARNTLLDTTELVHESYLRFVQSGRLRLEDGEHFMGYVGKIMRSVVVDTVRERLAQRRGGEQRAMTLNSQLGAPDGDRAANEILAVHEALDGLAQYDRRLVQVVEMRYFGGLTEGQIAATLGVTERTVRRDWEKARLLLAELLL
jgi:RNA polymerase sigma factor (TIGR02999 family)